LRAAEIKIVGLESKIVELRKENAALRQKLGDPGPIPECLIRKPAAAPRVVAA